MDTCQKLLRSAKDCNASKRHGRAWYGNVVKILSVSSLACPSSLECLSAESPISFSKYSILSAIVAWCKEPQEHRGCCHSNTIIKIQCAPAAKAKYETLGLGWISQLLMGLVYLAFDLVSEECVAQCLTVFTQQLPTCCNSRAWASCVQQAQHTHDLSQASVPLSFRPCGHQLVQALLYSRQQEQDSLLHIQH